MKTGFIVLLVLAGGLAAYFLRAPKVMQDQAEQMIINQEDYQKSADEIAARIDNLSPTPPTAEDWIVREVEFVKNEPYAYVTYHDTHNIFRILVKTVRSETQYRAVATFEPAYAEASAGKPAWKLTNGQDLAKGKETVKIDINNN